MPDSFWLTDWRIQRACAVLGVKMAEAQEWAKERLKER